MHAGSERRAAKGMAFEVIALGSTFYTTPDLSGLCQFIHPPPKN